MTALILAAGAIALLPFLHIFPGWFDSGEFAAAAVGLDVSHQSGHPVYVNAANLASFIPLGSVDFRLQLFSLLCILAAAFGMSRIVHSVSPDMPGRTSYAVALLAGAAVLLHPSVALQANRTEVYALQFALTVLALFLSMRFAQRGDARCVFGAFAVSGLAFALQPLLTAVFVPVLLIALMRRHGDLTRIAPTALLMAAFTSCAYLYLPFRALAEPAINWGAPSTWPRFVAVLTARDFRVFFHSPLSAKAQEYFWRGDLWHLVPPALLVLSVAGLIFLWRRRRRLEAGLLLVALVSPAVAWLLKDFYLRNPDAHAYVAFPVAVSICLAASAAATVARYVPGKILAALAGPLLLLGAMGDLPLEGVSSLKSHGNIEADLLSSHLDRLPPRAVIHVRSDHWLFPLWYRTLVEGRRPDVAVLGSGLLRSSWYVDGILRRHGVRDPDRVWYETPPAALDTDAGFLFGPARPMRGLVEAVSGACRASSRHDPFETLASICAEIVLGPTATLRSAGRHDKAIVLLEKYFDRPPTGTPCPVFLGPALPFPLDPLRRPGFLAPPFLPETELAVLYLGCGRPLLAREFLESLTGHLRPNRVLIPAYLAWLEGDPSLAYDLLRPEIFSKRASRGLIFLARATLHALDGNAEAARIDARHAERLLKDASAEIAALNRIIGSIADES